jgi:autotransporter strand-loop-strand O-heptosyltransferase
MIEYKMHHVNGLFFEITGDENKNREYDIKFIDNKNNTILYETKMKVGTWARLERKYLSDIAIVISYKGRIIKQINLLSEIKGKRVFISFESKALGDTLAWIPYCLDFAKYYQCQVIVSTFKNHLFKNVYPELEFVDRGVTVNNLFAMFEIGWYWDKSKEPINPVTIPLQQSASNILHLPHKEIKPLIDFKSKERPINEKYVCISIHSTSGLKLWAYWQEAIDFLIQHEYKVIEISDMSPDHKSVLFQPELKNIIHLEDKSLYNTMNYIYHSEFFIGLSSGLSWLAWTLHKRVYMISNFTDKNHEFISDCIRIYDEKICHGCWNNPKFRFDKGNWEYCPEHEDTLRHFECHKLITADRVIKLIEENEFI